MYIVEGYSEFSRDIKEIWKDFLEQFRFELIEASQDFVKITNKKCTIELHLGVEQRVFYFFRNPLTGNKLDYVLLQIYFGIPFERNLVGGKDYPIPSKEWLKLFSNEDFRTICQIDLPIVRDEIVCNWIHLLEGDFSFEDEYFEWKKWYEKQKEKGMSYQVLSVDFYRNRG